MKITSIVSIIIALFQLIISPAYALTDERKDLFAAAMKDISKSKGETLTIMGALLAYNEMCDDIDTYVRIFHNKSFKFIDPRNITHAVIISVSQEKVTEQIYTDKKFQCATYKYLFSKIR